jgi:hypothetical protein
LPDSLVLNVRQLAQYPVRNPVDPTDLILVQAGGLGGPYYAATTANMLSTAGITPAGPLTWGVGAAPAAAAADQVMTGDSALLGGGAVLFNAYAEAFPNYAYWQSGPAALFQMPTGGGFAWDTAASGTAGAAITWQGAMSLSPAGHLTVTDQVSVGRDPTAPLELVTLQYLTSRTYVPSAPFAWGVGAPPAAAANGQIMSGAMAIAPDGALLFNAYVTPASTHNYLDNGPADAFFMGPDGTLYFWTAPSGTAGAPITWLQETWMTPAGHLNLADQVTVARDPTAPLELVTLQYVTAHLAPVASPAFTGTPTAATAAPGASTTQLATTAFVAAAVAAAGVASFNTRIGAVVLTAADVTGVGGALLAGPAFTGAPTAPTAAAATSTTQIATTAFVTTALAGPLAAPLTGVSNGSAAAAGQVGEYLTANASSVALASNVTANVCTLNLTPGDWDIWGEMQLSGTGFSIAYSTISPGGGLTIGGISQLQLLTANAAAWVSPLAAFRVSITATTTYTLTALAVFPSGTCAATGAVMARRRR